MPILNRANEEPERIAISHGQNRLTYSQLAERIRRIAHGLQDRRSASDRIAILSRNRLEYAEVFLGAVYAGFVPVLLDPKWSLSDIHRVIDQCQPNLIFCEEDLSAMIAGEHSHYERLLFSNEQQGSFDVWLAACKPEAIAAQPNETLFIGYTSGTTGVPKGFMRSHRSWILSFQASKRAFRLDKLEQAMAPGPFVHSLSLFVLVQTLFNGATFHMLPEFDAAEVMKVCDSVTGMTLFVVPSMIDSLLRLAQPGTTSIQALISSGGQWSSASKRRCGQVFAGTKLYEYYGSSEASYISYLDASNKEKLGSLGKPFDGVDITIRDEQFQEVPAGTIGQVYVRSEMVFSGYYLLPDETENVFRDGWLKTGDYMYTDNDHYLYLAGRTHNMIKTGGLKVFPEEVEAVLRQIPNVREVMVVGKPHAYWGEQVTAMIQWRGGQALSLDEIKRLCDGQLAKHKLPKELISVDKFIYTSSGKVARQAMKDDWERVMG
ncbi:class I adenylate-forming enzyme family protein [Paenibacillus glycanilyticus]|nr:AMP-binding protein [Paenibacillus glycanilyticus]